MEMDGKKIVLFGKRSLLLMQMAIFCCLLGCSSASRDALQAPPQMTESEFPKAEPAASPAESQMTERELLESEMAQICEDIYLRAAEEGRLSDPQVIHSIVSWYGEHGYVAVDSRNQVDMTGAQQAMRFCEAAEAGEDVSLTVIRVGGRGETAVYDLNVESGQMEIVRSRYEYRNGFMQRTDSISYQAEDWKYTPEGYLIFCGKWFSEQTYVLMLSGAEEYTALRIWPLDGKCRKMNEEYIFPVGYEHNNMFLTDWSEDDFGELNFYDLYDKFYPRVNGRPVPYRTADDLNEGAVYDIPQESFEFVLQSYLRIDSETLREKTVYIPQERVYEYRPRGFYEAESSHPYPEVTAYRENGDSTITLTVHAVYPKAGLSRAHTHEVTVRPGENGSVQYVSNRVLPSEEGGETRWHTPRLTQAQWKAVYGER